MSDKPRPLYWFEQPFPPVTWRQRWVNCWIGYDLSPFGWDWPLAFLITVWSCACCAAGYHPRREEFSQFGLCCFDCGHRIKP